jgi:hypothetical protein
MWSGITFYCSNHPNEKFQLKQGAYSVYYGCSHEYDEIDACHNRLNLIDAEKAVQHLMDLINGHSFSDSIINLTNYKWTQNGISFKVVYHNNETNKMKILVDNKKIMQNR